MKLDGIKQFLTAAPAMRLLRSNNSVWVIEFLIRQFKHAQNITVPHSELVVALDHYLEKRGQVSFLAENGEATLENDHSELSYRDLAEGYLTAWCSASTGWLKRFLDARSSEPIYQLTHDAEQVLAFVRNATRPRAVIGTQSRLRSVIDLLDSVANGSAGCRQQRIAELESQQAQIQEELVRLRRGDAMPKLDPALAREQFTLAVNQLEALKSDFRGVEDRFRSIVYDVQQHVSAADQARGEILDFALSAEELLLHSDQGKSFFEFLKLLHAPDNQRRVAELVDRLAELDLISAQQDDLQNIRSMMPNLLAEAEKILRTTQHLSLVLRRLLDTRSTRHQQQLAQLLRDICKRATELSACPPLDIGLEVEVELDLCLPLERPFWMHSEPFETVELKPAPTNTAAQAQALEQLTALEHIDWQSMRQVINDRVESQGPTELAELIAQSHPISGPIELLAYLQIAHDDGHSIDGSRSIAIAIGRSFSEQRFEVPSVTFLPREQRSDRRAGKRQQVLSR